MMKLLSILMLFGILLCGCASEPENTVPTETAEPVVEITLPEATSPETLPLDGIELLMKDMTLEEKVGQLFLARCPEENAIADIETYHLGGYILFGRDFENETPETIRQTIADYQNAANIPLLIAVDEEGGTVNRVSRYEAFRSEPFPSPRNSYASGGLEAVLKAETEKCDLLYSLGINVNMAPVCDITTDPTAFMYRRSLGLSPEETGSVIASIVRTMDSCRVGSVLKHFPGYGNNTDTHTAMAVDSRPLEELEKADLIPFATGIDAGCGAVLISHTIIEALDPEYPASLSPAVHRYLRERMGFGGVAVTDDLIMAAITDAYGAGEAAVLAVLAGNDLLCSSEYQIQYEAVLTAAQDGRIPPEILDAAVRRVLRWKQDLGLI